MFRTLGALMFGAVMLAAGSAVAQTTYSYNGNLYDTFTNFSNCSSGSGCANFSSAQRPVGTFQTATPLAGGLTQVDITSQVTAYQFNDGLTLYDKSDPQSRLYRFYVWTDAAGNLTGISTIIQRWRVSNYLPICEARTCSSPTTHTSAGYVDPENKIDQLFIFLTTPPEAYHNLSCTRRGASPSGTAESCTSYAAVGVDPNASKAVAPTAPYPVVAPTPVPTMTEWAMILFGLILAGGAAMTIQRRRMA